MRGEREVKKTKKNKKNIKCKKKSITKKKYS